MPVTDLPLRDIHLPEAIGWWPPAIGWWLLVVLVPGLSVCAFWLYKRLTRKTALKTARKQLAALKHDHTRDDFSKLAELSALLRRVAISIEGRARVASLTGTAWLGYLDSTVEGAPFSEGVGRIFSEAHYRPTAPEELALAELFKLCEDWLKAQSKRKR
ncbi:MAG: DUF4381 domain-containing protein [Gammaproteobacteria bacterium]